MFIENPPRRARVFVGKREQQMLRADVFVLELLRFRQRRVKGFIQALRDIQLRS